MGTDLGSHLGRAGSGLHGSFDQLRRQLDRIELPADYVLLEERLSGDRLAYGGPSRVVRSYRAPRPFEPTCEEIRSAGAAFSRGPSTFRRYDGQGLATCTATFERRSFTGGITAVDAPDPKRARALALEPRDYVRVDVQIID